MGEVRCEKCGRTYDADVYKSCPFDSASSPRFEFCSVCSRIYDKAASQRCPYCQSIDIAAQAPSDHDVPAPAIAPSKLAKRAPSRQAHHGRVVPLMAAVAVIGVGFWIYQAASVGWPGLSPRPDSYKGDAPKPSRQPADQQVGHIPAAESDARVAGATFTMSRGMDANGTVIGSAFYIPSIADCEDQCARMPACGVFSYSKISKKCYLYKTATLSRNEYFDTGTFAKAADQRAQPAPDANSDSKAATGTFAIARGMRADGTELTGGISYDSSPVDCQGRCARMAACSVFSYSEISRYCYLYGTAALKKSASFVSGTRSVDAGPGSADPGSLKSALAKPGEDRARPAPTPERDVKAPADAFTMLPGKEAWGSSSTVRTASTIGDCQGLCARSEVCRVFTYNKTTRNCFLYHAGATLKGSSYYDSGIRN